MGLVNKAKSFGMTIPTSAAQLNSMCSRRLQYFGEGMNANWTEGMKNESADITGESKRYNDTEHANSSLVVESADSCSTGLLGMAMNKYPDAQRSLRAQERSHVLVWKRSAMHGIGEQSKGLRY